jgi:rhodanese-related sulfurtransferase
LVIGSFRRFFQLHPVFLRLGKFGWVILALVVLTISVCGAYYYEQYKQNKEYALWVEESKRQDIPNTDEQTDNDNLDKLKLGESEGEDVLSRGETVNDAGLAFIYNYYNNLGSGRVEEAYSVSSKIVSLETYRSWYIDTNQIIVDSAQKISENKYSLGLTLREKTGTIRYGVLMTLMTNEQGIYSIKDSDVRILADLNSGGDETPVEEPKIESTVFYDNNQHLDLSVSNEEFQSILSQGQPVYVLDAREDEEFEIGYFPGSYHIRFADLLAGEWIGLPQDRVVYVFCWSGVRGKEVAEFLRSKKILTRYIATGADGWVDFGGLWSGGIKFLSKYSAERYQVVFTTDQVKQYQQQGVFIVDSRHPSKYNRRHIQGSVSIPVIYTPTSQLEQALSQVPPNSTVLTVCDDFISCFDAKITGVKLERRGNTFLGRYNKPWEY